MGGGDGGLFKTKTDLGDQKKERKRNKTREKKRWFCLSRLCKQAFTAELHSFRSTWDDHLFEIVLPKPCCVGHVDLKFTLHPLCTTAPNIEVRFLSPTPYFSCFLGFVNAVG